MQVMHNDDVLNIDTAFSACFHMDIVISCTTINTWMTRITIQRYIVDITIAPHVKIMELHLDMIMGLVVKQAFLSLSRKTKVSLSLIHLRHLHSDQKCKPLLPIKQLLVSCGQQLRREV